MAWNPNLKQRKVYNAVMSKGMKYVDAKGDPRSGKSEVFYHLIRALALTQRGIRILVTRDTGTQLSTASYKHFLSVLEDGLIEESGSRTHPFPILKFKTGSEVLFLPFDEMDTTKAGSSEYAVVFMEEAHRSSLRQWGYFQRRLSQQTGDAIGPDGKRYKSVITYRGLWTARNSNGHNWAWQIFTRDHPLAEQGLDPKFLSVKFLMQDNEQNLPKDYLDDIWDLPPHMRKQYIGATEEPEQGLVFPHFNRAIHEVPISNFVPPWNWRIFFGLDHGYQTPTHGNWGAINEDGFIIVFKEYRREGMTIPENALNILNMERENEVKGIPKIEVGGIDPSTGMKDGKNASGLSTYEQYLHEGANFLYLAPRMHIKDRIDMTARALIPRKAFQKHPITGEFREEGWPKLMFTSDCQATIQEHEEWEWSPNINNRKDPTGLPVQKDDHGIDATMYLQLVSGEGTIASENELTLEAPKNDPNYWTKEAVRADIEEFDKKRRQEQKIIRPRNNLLAQIRRRR